jgi:hypothetical protein
VLSKSELRRKVPVAELIGVNRMPARTACHRWKLLPLSLFMRLLEAPFVGEKND